MIATAFSTLLFDVGSGKLTTKERQTIFPQSYGCGKTFGKN